MQRLGNWYLACWAIAAVTLVFSFTLAGAVPPSWLLAVMAVSILLALGAFFAGGRGRDDVGGGLALGQAEDVALRDTREEPADPQA